MKSSVQDIVRYSYCPKFYEQQGDIPLLDPAAYVQFKELITYVFRKELERESKTPWKFIFERWTKIFWSGHTRGNVEDEQKFNRSLIALRSFYDWYQGITNSVLAVNFTLDSSLYGHQILGDIPVVLTNGDKTV